MIVLELQKYWKRFRAFSDIFGSALRLTYTGSYHIVQRYFSERTSRLRVFFENVQQRLFICLVWSLGDVSHVYGSFGGKTVKFEGHDVFGWDPPLSLSSRTALGWPLTCRRVPHTLSLPYLSPSLGFYFSPCLCRPYAATGGHPPLPDLSHT